MDPSQPIEYVVRAETTPCDDVSGTAFAHLDVRTLVGGDRQGSTRVMVGQTIYPANGGTHEHHLHPDAEEVVVVTRGSGWHRVGDQVFRIREGDVVFVPRNTAHSAGADGPEEMQILWVLGGAASLATAGYVSVPEIDTSPS
jgi:quercetin dioxygenase-like cupin family protein